MSYKKFAKSYKQVSVETASPGKIILMLYDGALRFIAAAKKGFEEENISLRNETINNNLAKARNIILDSVVKLILPIR